MMSRNYLFTLLASLAASSLLLTACGDEADLQCGEGTTEQSGKCVAIGTPSTVECGEGTVLNPSTNQCVASETETPDEITCGFGTELDETGKNCIPSEGPPPIKCGPGTVLEGRACVAEVSCSEGETAIGGFCLTPAEELASADDAQNIDEPAEITLPAESERFIFTGTIDAPAEVEGDLVQNTDSFTFEGQAGQWLEITLQSLGLPAPAFKIEAIPGEDDEPFTYERFSPLGSASIARHVVLPYTATYKVTILPEQTLTNADGLFGDESWNYVGTVKHLEAPQATTVEIPVQSEGAEELAGHFNILPQNFYLLETAEDAHKISLTVENAGANAVGALLVFSEDNTLLHTFENITANQIIEFDTPHEPAYALVDWIQSNGPRVGYKIQASTLDQRLPLKLDAQSSHTFENLSAPANSVIKLSFKSESIYPINLSVLDESGELLGKVRPVQGQGRTLEVVNYAFYAAGGEFSVVAANESDIDHDTQLVIEIIEPQAIGALTTGAPLVISQPLPARSFSFFLIDSVEPGSILNFSQLNTQMFYESLVTVSLHQANGEISMDDELLISADEDGWGAPIELVHYQDDGGPLLVQIENFEFDDFDPFTFTIQATGTTTIPTADPAGVQAGESLEYIHTESLQAGEHHWLRLVVAEPIELSAVLSALPPGDVDIRGFTTDFTLFLLAEQQGDDAFDVRIPAGTYLFQVSAHADTDDGYTLSGTTEAAYPVLNGTTTQSSFEDAIEISTIPARINGEAASFEGGVHQFWKFTAAQTTTIQLDMTHLGGAFAMHVDVYAADKTTVLTQTTEPLGVDATTDNRRATLDFPVTAGQTYYLHVGGRNTTSSTSLFTYTVKITDAE